ncbi:MAG: hypothetical protein U0Q15_06205 [Kineosporiaceae bacterium]
MRRTSPLSRLLGRSRGRRLVPVVGGVAAIALAGGLIAAAGQSAQAGPGTAPLSAQAQEQAQAQAQAKPSVTRTKPTKTKKTKSKKTRTKKTRTSVPPTTVVTTSSTGGKVTCSLAPTQLVETRPTALVFLLYSSDMCIVPGPSSFTVAIYASLADADAGRNAVATGGGPAGTRVVVEGVLPDTSYWYVTSDFRYSRGPVHTPTLLTPTSPAPSASVTTCVPLATHVVSTTPVSVTVADPPCYLGRPGTWTVAAYGSDADARARTNPVASATGPHGPLTITGLTPGRQYWVRGEDGVVLPVLLPLPSTTWAAAGARG